MIQTINSHSTMMLRQKSIATGSPRMPRKAAAELTSTACVALSPTPVPKPVIILHVRVLMQQRTSNRLQSWQLEMKYRALGLTAKVRTAPGHLEGRPCIATLMILLSQTVASHSIVHRSVMYVMPRPLLKPMYQTLIPPSSMKRACPFVLISPMASQLPKTRPRLSSQMMEIPFPSLPLNITLSLVSSARSLAW